jgi:hypothetical protein
MMGNLVSIITVIFSLLLPNSLLLVIAIPTLLILSGYMDVIPPVLTFGDKTIQIYDFVILTLIVKLFAKFCLTGFQVHIQAVHRHIALFITVLFAATLLAFFRFGPVIFLSELFAFFRFFMMISIFFLFFYSVTTAEDLNSSDRYFRMLGMAICLSVYASIFLYLLVGIHFGEVQDTGGMVRYFGPLGDQVGFIIVLFCIRELIAGRMLHVAFYGGAIFATGTRGALLALVVSLVMFLLSHRKAETVSPKWIKIAGFVVGAGVLLSFGAIMLTRFTDVEMLKTGLTQRTLSMGLGWKVFMANILTGVGYSGFRFAALEYNPESLFATFVENVITNTSNQLIQVATDAGLPGLIVFILLMVSCYSTLKSAETSAPYELKDTFTAGRIWLVSLLIGNQTAVWMLQGSMITYLFWILIAMAAVSTMICPLKPDTDLFEY